jgi:DMSO reductase family type II enzyme heme b subunit
VDVKPEIYKGEELKGKKIYERKCAWCHGADGAGGGPSSVFLTPAPRDFTFGFFKWRTTPFDDYSPSANDLYRMISQGVIGTSMPGWADVLSKAEVKDVADYVKALGRFEYSQNAGTAPVKINASTDALIRGKRHFLDRCSECHGELGRGDSLKRLKDDWGGRSWPRDLTKGWTFRFGASASDIYARITTGISGTQMPSFADPKSRKMLTEDERKDVAVYAVSLQELDRSTEAKGVIRAQRASGELPQTPDANEWQAARWTAFRLIPQMAVGERLFKPTIDSISVKALYNENDVAFLIEWDDPTFSLPGDLKSTELAEGALYQDAVAVQMPAVFVKKPYFGMGNANAVVDILFWLSPASAGKNGSVKFMRAKGHDNIEKVEIAKAGGMFAEGIYNKGRWKVVMKRPLNAERLAGGASAGVLAGKRFMPVAFAVWDGSNGESGARHTMTPWQWLSLEPEKNMGIYQWPLVIAIIVFAGEIFIYKTMGKKS